jgi:hypothetical protein
VSLQLCDPLQQEPASSLLHQQGWGDSWPLNDPTML